MKTCVVFYSHSGNVRFYGERIAEKLAVPAFSLEPVSPLKGTGFGSIFKGGGQAVTGQKPALKELPDLSGFDRVVLGLPVWAGRCAAPAYTFLSSGALKEKSVCLFTLSGSGKDEKALAMVRAAAGGVSAHTALVDRAVKASAGNEEKLAVFLKEIEG